MKTIASDSKIMNEQNALIQKRILSPGEQYIPLTNGTRVSSEADGLSSILKILSIKGKIPFPNT